jgi:amidase
MYSNSVVLSALDPYYARDQKRVENFDSTWTLERDSGIAVLTKPTDRLKNFQVKLAPMLGCIGVAPPGGQAFRSGELGNYGGNMDYNQLREGVTLYLPVFQPGALLFVGDGHAAPYDFCAFLREVPRMARTVGTIPAGSRIPDDLSPCVIAKFFP